MVDRADLNDLALSILIALGINVVFVAVAALAYWLLGVPQMIGALTTRFVALWGGLFVVTLVLNPIERIFRLNIYDHATAYIALNTLMGGLLLLAFAANTALRTQPIAAASSLGVAIVLHIIGFLACYIAHAVITPIFRGQLYVLINFGAALGGYGLFALWPGAARMLFGWLFLA